LPDRTEGVTVADAETADFARRLAAAVRRESGADPHLVVCRVHRIKIDCNRERAEATGGHPLTGALWETYHDAIRQARRTVEATHGHGLYVELHGHSHLLPRIELGYLLDAADLARSDEEWDGLPALAARSSVRDLARRSGEPLAALVRGPRSFGALLERHGLPAVPSPARPAPGDLPYFPGGYGVRVHGSGEGGSGTISAIQVELPRPTMRETADLREATARRMAAALREYWALHGNSR
jgi:hypothetical protein